MTPKLDGKVALITGSGRGIGRALASVMRAQVGQPLAISARHDPRRAKLGKASGQIDLHRIVGIRARSVIHRERWVFLSAKQLRCIAEHDLAHRHANTTRSFDMDFA